MKIATLIDHAKQECLQNDLDTHCVEYLLQEILMVNATMLNLKKETEIAIADLQTFQDIFQKYINKQGPIQYLLGYSYFLNRKLIVNPNVLIPRFETEELVKHAINQIKQNNYTDVLDLCCGSGCIAISLKLECNNIKVSASDICKKALEVAKQNAKMHNVEIDFFASDLLQQFIINKQTFDLIVCNPPYIDYKDEEVDKIVKLHEPALALYARDQGLEKYKKILKDISKVIKPKGMVIFEIGYQQALVLQDYIVQQFNKKVYIYKDINQHDRFLLIKF